MKSIAVTLLILFISYTPTKKGNGSDAELLCTPTESYIECQIDLTDTNRLSKKIEFLETLLRQKELKCTTNIKTINNKKLKPL